jgi:hypothetical protein
MDKAVKGACSYQSVLRGGVSLAKTRTKAELTAYARFLTDERLRHLKDVELIECKLKILTARGIIPGKPGDWISEKS